MSVRRGRDRFLSPDAYEPIEVIAHALDLYECRDLAGTLDPERVASVLGVTANGEFDTAAVETFGEKLWTNGTLGVDLLVVPPYSGFPPHIHPGHHLLLCLAGRGTFSVNEETYDARFGEMHMIEGGVPHAVGNPYDTPHVLLAIGSPHRELDSPERMKRVTWDGRPLHVPVDA
jgi:quercetin dioxygenase-like cupin family protein